MVAKNHLIAWAATAEGSSELVDGSLLFGPLNFALVLHKSVHYLELSTISEVQKAEVCELRSK